MIIGDIYRHAAQTPDKTALIHDGVAWSYAEFARAIRGSRQHLAKQKLRPGSMAVLAIHHLREAWVHGVALHSLGITTICVPAGETLRDLKPREIECVVATQLEPGPELAEQASSLGWRYLGVPVAQPDGTAALPKAPPPSQPRGGHVVMTSGTTGEYKMVLRDAAMEASTFAHNARMGGIDASSVVYVGDFPLLTAGGWRWPLLTWHAGGAVVFHQGADPLGAMLASDVTQAYATPGTLVHLLRGPAGQHPRNDSMRLLVTGGAMPQVMAQAVRERLTRRVCSMLASTEALVLAITPIEGADDLQWHRIHPAREVQVVDEADRPLPAGQVGMVRARLFDGLAGYLDEPELSRQFFRDGYFYPGDLGMFGADGRLALHGRVTDVINALGTKIATGPIEQALENRFGAHGVYIFSVSGATGEEEVHIAIQPGKPVQREELEHFAKTTLGMFARVHFHGIELMPRNHMGKIRRLELRQQIMQRLRKPLV